MHIDWCSSCTGEASLPEGPGAGNARQVKDPVQASCNHGCWCSSHFPSAAWALSLVGASGCLPAQLSWRGLRGAVWGRPAAWGCAACSGRLPRAAWGAWGPPPSLAAPLMAMPAGLQRSPQLLPPRQGSLQVGPGLLRPADAESGPHLPAAWGWYPPVVSPDCPAKPVTHALQQARGSCNNASSYVAAMLLFGAALLDLLGKNYQEAAHKSKASSSTLHWVKGCCAACLLGRSETCSVGSQYITRGNAD